MLSSHALNKHNDNQYEYVYVCTSIFMQIDVDDEGKERTREKRENAIAITNCHVYLSWLVYKCICVYICKDIVSNWSCQGAQPLENRTCVQI